jgi:hypothetical protein
MQVCDKFIQKESVLSYIRHVQKDVSRTSYYQNCLSSEAFSLSFDRVGKFLTTDLMTPQDEVRSPRDYDQTIQSY